MTRRTDPAPPDDQALIARARTGDGEAFAALVRRYQGPVHGCARALLGDPHLAHDAAQEAFLCLYRQLDRLRDAHTLPGYLRIITRRVATRLFRQTRREAVALQALRPELRRSCDHPHEPEDKDLQDRALHALHALTPPLREVLVLHYLKGCTHREIAAFLSVPKTSVNNRLHKARQALAKETLNMVSKAHDQHALPEDFVERIGRITAASGPVVEVRFEDGLPQEEHDVLVGTERNRRLVAIQRLPDGIVRCLVARKARQQHPTGRVISVEVGEEALEVGQSVAAAPTEPVPGVGDDEIAELVGALTPRAAAPAEMLPTGLKSLDLLFPLARGGRVQLLGMHRESRAGAHL